MISGGRCPATNNDLRQTRSGGVVTKRLHREGRAIDVRLPGMPLTALHQPALTLPGFDDLANILFDQALLAEGGMPADPAAYVRRVNALLV